MADHKGVRGMRVIQYGRIYKTLFFSDKKAKEYCYYCGMPADTIDHCPPVSKIEIAIGSEPNCDIVKVPCCRECNNVLSDNPVFTLAKRKNYINIWIKRKYKTEIEAAEMWDDDSLSELSGMMFDNVSASIECGKEVLKRINYPCHEIDWDKTIEEYEETHAENVLEPEPTAERA